MKESVDVNNVPGWVWIKGKIPLTVVVGSIITMGTVLASYIRSLEADWRSGYHDVDVRVQATEMGIVKLITRMDERDKADEKLWHGLQEQLDRRFSRIDTGIRDVQSQIGDLQKMHMPAKDTGK